MSDANTTRDWWRGCTIYQIYPRSFKDSNDDGIGDLGGVLDKLDYIASLKVDAIWLSPFFRSPMTDFGYDVSDYRDVDPMFGTLDDFDRLVEAAHERGLKVLIDQVLSHSSDEHAWFLESRLSREGDKADWYVWADAKPDGTPPNNWMSIFGGPAWEWEPRRQQYYLHNFLRTQPDLNFHNPAVRAQLLEEVEFWLKRGVDGFRLDTANFYFHDAELRDNPPRPHELAANDVLPLGYPYTFQQHIYDRNRPDTLVFLRELRALLDRYPGTTTVGELGGDDPLPLMAEYTSGGDTLHMAYSFSFLTDRFSAAHVRYVIRELEGQINDGWPCWTMGNHDVERLMSRWGKAIGHEDDDALAKLLLALLTSLRGSVCIYQGEELGLPEVAVPQDKLQDPYGITLWPLITGRDGCRTAIPWSEEGEYAGFSAHEPWLSVPFPGAHRKRAADVQERSDDSVLAGYRRFLAWRHTQPVLRSGRMRLAEAPGEGPDDVVVFVREDEAADGGARLLCAFNLSPEPRRAKLAEGAGTALEGHGFAAAEVVSAGDQGAVIELPGFGAYFAAL
ncbi:alpha-amylase family glycosyl hydrolase [Haliangium ochraceum]|uniref:Alpha amylase catalytic region n=1 Tax=Haliangium ochraceum (strain DSM 14365 / JCM 11303 / SMP-2) TaxID=502025 RepID=D0LLX5_HALO1|nr:alpha-amylase family glycosyl hydrolase [Haliangium ochraceum]ACY15153.1 alpha amylase catalytic region [Haliangium ochraceum DSM 14365]